MNREQTGVWQNIVDDCKAGTSRSINVASNKRRVVVLVVDDEIKRLRHELFMVSKLAADTPQFYNPLNASHAKEIRDRVLIENKHGEAK